MEAPDEKIKEAAEYIAGVVKKLKEHQQVVAQGVGEEFGKIFSEYQFSPKATQALTKLFTGIALLKLTMDDLHDEEDIIDLAERIVISSDEFLKSLTPR